MSHGLSAKANPGDTMTVLRAGVAAGLALAIAGCDSDPLRFNASREGTILVAELGNLSGGPITHTDPVHTSWLQPDEDLVIFFRRNGTYIGQCARLDQVPARRAQLAPGATVSIRLDARQLASMFCLEDGYEYDMGVAWVRWEAGGYRVVSRSDTRRVVAVGTGKGDGRVGFAMSPDGDRLLPTRCIDGGCEPVDSGALPSTGE